MPKDIDKIMSDVEHNLNKASIKKTNGLSIDKEAKALINNLNDIFDSDYWQECQETMDRLRKEAMELYPEYFIPIVAEDPLVVVYDRVLDIIKKSLNKTTFSSSDNSIIVHLDLHCDAIFQMLFFDIICKNYDPAIIAKLPWTQSEIEYSNNRAINGIDDFLVELAKYISRYQNHDLESSEKEKIKANIYILLEGYSKYVDNIDFYDKKYWSNVK